MNALSVRPASEIDAGAGESWSGAEHLMLAHETRDVTATEEPEETPDDPGDDTPQWRERLATAWEWISGIFHGYAGTDQLKKRGP